MNKWIFTKEENYINGWNKFVSSAENSSFLQKTHRLNSYEQYKCKYELQLLLNENNEIIAGSANIIINYPLFKIYFCSFGPIVSIAELAKLDLYNYTSEFVKRSKILSCFCCQLSLPIIFKDKMEMSRFKAGVCFNKITLQGDINKISLQDDNFLFKDKENLIATFTSNGRRDVRSSYRKELVCKIAQDINDLKSAYKCIEINAKTKGYTVRSWNDFGPYLIKGYESGDLHILMAIKETIIVGAIVLEKSGDTLNYTIGGIQRTSPDNQAGYFLQMEAMLYAIKLGYKFYNISSGGPVDVQRFKSQFNPKLSKFSFHCYHINNKFIYLLYIIFLKVDSIKILKKIKNYLG